MSELVKVTRNFIDHVVTLYLKVVVQCSGLLPLKADLKLEVDCMVSLCNVDHLYKTLQELRMLPTVTLNCQVTNIVMNLGCRLSE